MPDATPAAAPPDAWFATDEPMQSDVAAFVAQLRTHGPALGALGIRPDDTSLFLGVIPAMPLVEAWSAGRRGLTIVLAYWPPERRQLLEGGWCTDGDILDCLGQPFDDRDLTAQGMDLSPRAAGDIAGGWLVRQLARPVVRRTIRRGRRSAEHIVLADTGTELWARGSRRLRRCLRSGACDEETLLRGGAPNGA